MFWATIAVLGATLAILAEVGVLTGCGGPLVSRDWPGQSPTGQVRGQQDMAPRSQMLPEHLTLKDIRIVHGESRPPRSGGRLDLTGIAVNDGHLPLFSPKIIFRVYDSNGKMVEEKVCWPGGYGRNLHPGKSVRFIFTAFLMEKGSYTWSLSVENYPFDVLDGSSSSLPSTREGSSSGQ